MNTRKPHNKLLFNTYKREGNLFTNRLQNIDDLFINHLIQYYYKCCEQATRKETQDMVEVKYWETNSQRKKEEPIGIFSIDITPKEVTPVNTKLTGKKLQADKKRFEEETEKALLDCKFAALDKVREIVGYEGVLVANIAEESEEK